jgi:hypothetical protein
VAIRAHDLRTLPQVVGKGADRVPRALLEIADLFRLTSQQAAGIAREVVATTARWQDVAARLSISAAELERMARAFEHDEARAARAS